MKFGEDNSIDTQVRIGVLLVDDFEPFRNWLTSFFQTEPDFEIVGHASDGEQAVEQAKQLRPSLVIVDIALPRLNGIEVTRRIRAASLDSKIVFLTGNDFPQVVREALDAGANGYVIKTDAAGELLAALKVVLLGGRYVSAKLRNRGFDAL